MLSLSSHLLIAPPTSIIVGEHFRMKLPLTGIVEGATDGDEWHPLVMCATTIYEAFPEYLKIS